MGMFLAPAIGSVINGVADRISIGTQVIIRAELNTAVYTKALRLSARSVEEFWWVAGGCAGDCS